MWNIDHQNTKGGEHDGDDNLKLYVTETMKEEFGKEVIDLEEEDEDIDVKEEVAIDGSKDIINDDGEEYADEEKNDEIQQYVQDTSKILASALNNRFSMRKLKNNEEHPASGSHGNVLFLQQAFTYTLEGSARKNPKTDLFVKIQTLVQLIYRRMLTTTGCCIKSTRYLSVVNETYNCYYSRQIMLLYISEYVLSGKTIDEETHKRVFIKYFYDEIFPKIHGKGSKGSGIQTSFRNPQSMLRHNHESKNVNDLIRKQLKFGLPYLCWKLRFGEILYILSLY